LQVVAVATAADKAALWIEPASNILLDKQTSDEIASRAGLVVLRAAPTGPAGGYSYPEVVARIKRAAPEVPVLSYAWISRYRDRGRIEAYLLRGLDFGVPLAEQPGRAGRVVFVDVTDPGVRSAVVQRLATQRKQLGVDGFAVDGANRTPVVRPGPLARLCRSKPAFCEVYARSMDDLIGTLNAALGEQGMLFYNGLWNFEPGNLEDQARLLRHADGAAIEYFGLNPRSEPRGFTTDIRPYLDLVARLPSGKPVLFFGRGPWHYTDYAADYRRQRYLYASFLLARRTGDLFKYHASFQVPAHAGRSGGLDVYADWSIDLGEARAPYRVEAGLYSRQFSGGRVVVAPDDGQGGTLANASGYTPEGKALSGGIAMAPGEALILLDAPRKSPGSPEGRQVDAKKIAAWGWMHAELIRTPEGERLRLGPLPDELEGEHDLLLDVERSLAPFERLEIDAALAPASSVLAVAEIDDPSGRHMWAVISVEPIAPGARALERRKAVHFRTPRRGDETWPEVRVGQARARPIVLDGSKVLGATGYRFRRWSHVRFVGPLELAGVRLSRRTELQLGTEALPRLPGASVRTTTAQRAARKPSGGRVGRAQCAEIDC